MICEKVMVVKGGKEYGESVIYNIAVQAMAGSGLCHRLYCLFIVI